MKKPAQWHLRVRHSHKHPFLKKQKLWKPIPVKFSFCGQYVKVATSKEGFSIASPVVVLSASGAYISGYVPDENFVYEEVCLEFVFKNV